MPTFYKPTEVRGRRVIYRSIDPEETKRARRFRLIVAAFILILFTLGLLHGLAK